MPELGAGDVTVGDVTPELPEAAETASAAPETQTEPTEFEVPDKFVGEDGAVNVRAMAEAYAALEKKMGSPKEPDSALTPETPDARGEKLDPAAFEDSLGEYAKEYTETGALSEESLAKLSETHNVPEDYIMSHMAGQAALARERAREIHDMVGGPDEFGKMLRWVNDKLGEEEMQSFTADLWALAQSGNSAKIKSQLEGMNARWKSHVGEAWVPEVTGEDPAGNKLTPFRSMAEQQAFQSTEAYRAGEEWAHKEFDIRQALAKKMNLY